jgi:glycosyltransferase involved in cell wall biosynthesis
VITVSEYSKYDIHKLYQISNDKIDVAYNGVKEIYTPIDEIKREEVKADITDGDSYFVFVGALHPRKNLVGLFKAFDLFKVRGSSSCKLVIVGSKQWWTKGIRRAYEEMKYKDSVIFLGHLSPKRLNEVVASSLAMVYVSYFEGFGIPIIEAFKAGTAVITSNVTSMPEVAGNAAFIVDPFNHHEIAEAMNKVVSSPMEREKFIAMGKERATFFTWDKTADAVWKSIEKIIPKLS